MNHLVALGIGSYDVSTLCVLLLNRLLSILDIVLLLLSNLFGLLAALALVEYGETCLKSLEFAVDGAELVKDDKGAPMLKLSLTNGGTRRAIPDKPELTLTPGVGGTAVTLARAP